MNTKPPSDASVRRRWTQRDEAALAELQERRRTIMAENREPVALIVQSLGSVTLETTNGQLMAQVDSSILTDWLIANAEALRRALEPFDQEAGR